MRPVVFTAVGLGLQSARAARCRRPRARPIQLSNVASAIPPWLWMQLHTPYEQCTPRGAARGSAPCRGVPSTPAGRVEVSITSAGSSRVVANQDGDVNLLAISHGHFRRLEEFGHTIEIMRPPEVSIESPRPSQFNGDPWAPFRPVSAWWSVWNGAWGNPFQDVAGDGLCSLPRIFPGQDEPVA